MYSGVSLRDRCASIDAHRGAYGVKPIRAVLPIHRSRHLPVLGLAAALLLSTGCAVKIEMKEFAPAHMELDSGHAVVVALGPTPDGEGRNVYGNPYNLGFRFSGFEGRMEQVRVVDVSLVGVSDATPVRVELLPPFLTGGDSGSISVIAIGLQLPYQDYDVVATVVHMIDSREVTTPMRLRLTRAPRTEQRIPFW